jgi:hypothetical protein
MVLKLRSVDNKYLEIFETGAGEVRRPVYEQ